MRKSYNLLIYFPLVASCSLILPSSQIFRGTSMAMSNAKEKNYFGDDVSIFKMVMLIDDSYSKDIRSKE